MYWTEPWCTPNCNFSDRTLETLTTSVQAIVLNAADSSSSIEATAEPLSRAWSTSFGIVVEQSLMGAIPDKLTANNPSNYYFLNEQRQ